MVTRARRRLRVLAVLAVGTGVVAGSIGLGAPASASPYPSWADVQAAKGDQAKAQSEISTLNSAITSLQSRATTTMNAASGAGERYVVAMNAAQTAAARLSTLETQQARAAATAKASRQRVGQLVAQLSHSGGQQLTVTMLTDSKRAGDLLYQLGTMSNLTARTSSLLEKATADANESTALAAQAQAAQTELEKRRAAASNALTAANRAAATANSALAVQTKNQTQLIAQVAYLKGTTAAVEAKYYAGLAAATPSPAVAGGAGGSGAGGAGGAGMSGGAGASGSGGSGGAGASGASGAGSGGTSSGGTSSGSSGGSGSGSSGGSGGGSSSESGSGSGSGTGSGSGGSSSGSGGNGSGSGGSSGGGTTTPPKSTPPPVTTPPRPTSPPPSSGSSLQVNTAIAFARAQLGKAYVFGAAGPNAYDCSGLMMASYGAAGVYIGGHSVRWQYEYLGGQGRLVSYSSARPGDIIFYHNGNDGYYHDAMYLGGGMMIEAPNPSATVRIVAVRTFQMLGQVGRPVG